MKANNTGAAREIEPGRLRSFEDGDDTAMSMPTLPPRRPRNARGSAVTTAQPLSTAAGGSTDDVTVAPAAPQTRHRGSGSNAPKGPKDKVRPSNVHIPVRLWEPLAEMCQQRGLSHGEAIIAALEETHPRLQELVQPAPSTGGSLFDRRRSRAARNTDGPLTPLNYRLREADFEVLDDLVEQVGASSRGHLITAALTDYLNQGGN